VIFYINRLFLRNAEKLSDLAGLAFLALFGTFVYFGERNTFLKYKNG